MNFLEKYKLLKKSVPVQAVSLDSPECGEYVDYVYYSKNCYYSFDSGRIQDCIYTILGIWGDRLVDCTSVTESEKCYECIDSNKCHSCTYLMDCNNCTNCDFSTMLNSCSDCFGCVSLTLKKYCIFNRQFSKQDYFERIKKLKEERPARIMEQMLELKQKIPHPASQQFNSENCPYGNYIYNSKNSYWVFDGYYVENSGYNFISVNVKNSWDLYFAGNSDKSFVTERCYEVVDCDKTVYNCVFLLDGRNCTNCFYSSHLKNCSDCWGCVGLSNKKYCILNNQLTKEQYGKAVKDLKKELGWRI